MRIDILTCQPDLITSFYSHSIIKRAIDFNKVQINVHNLHDYSLDKHKKTDDYPYGGGAGLVMKIEPIDRCITKLKEENNYDEIIYMSPDGELLNQQISNELSLKENIIILCGHYKGVDERVRQHLITREISIGQYVLSGGELPACVLVDSIVRLLPGVLGDIESALEDSFQDNMIAPPIYTRPEIYKNYKVPDILLTGDTKKINEWLCQQSLIRTEKYKNKNNIHN